MSKKATRETKTLIVTACIFFYSLVIMKRGCRINTAIPTREEEEEKKTISS
jgi:hypothetical protein